MKVAIDLSPLYSGHKFRGIGFYTKRLVAAMKPLAKNQAGLDLEFVKSTDKLRFIQADLIHYPYFSPFFLTLPSKPLAPSVVTIHDLIPVKYPNYFLAGLKGRLRWERQKRRLKKIKAIFTDSQIWRQEINRLTGFPKEKIFSIPLAADKEFRKLPCPEMNGGNFSGEIKEKYQLPETFLLYVGDVNWNKNIPGLIRAFAAVIKQAQIEIKLVLVGKAFLNKELKETKELLQLIKLLDLNNKIMFLGYVPTEDLVAIYNLAAVYCQPSFDEGFGLPVLEAMACGCPVVAAKTGSLPEVCGGAAVMVDPDSINSIAEGIKQAIENRKKLSKKGFKQSRQFSWQKTARQTIKVYEKIYKQEN